jgi:hypothetical protein
MILLYSGIYPTMINFNSVRLFQQDVRGNLKILAKPGYLLHKCFFFQLEKGVISRKKDDVIAEKIMAATLPTPFLQ